MSEYPVGIIGGGAWGTALAAVMAGVHDKSLIWAREDDVVASINDSHVNSVYLPQLKLAPTIRATGQLTDMAQCDEIGRAHV